MTGFRLTRIGGLPGSIDMTDRLAAALAAMNGGEPATGHRRRAALLLRQWSTLAAQRLTPANDA